MQLFGIEINGILAYIICKSRAGKFYWKTAQKIERTRRSKAGDVSLTFSEYVTGSYFDGQEPAIASALAHAKRRNLLIDGRGNESIIQRVNNLPRKESHLFKKKEVDHALLDLAHRLAESPQYDHSPEYRPSIPASAEEKMIRDVGAIGYEMRAAEMPKLQAKPARRVSRK